MSQLFTYVLIVSYIWGQKYLSRILLNIISVAKWAEVGSLCIIYKIGSTSCVLTTISKLSFFLLSFLYKYLFFTQNGLQKLINCFFCWFVLMSSGMVCFLR